MRPVNAPDFRRRLASQAMAEIFGLLHRPNVPNDGLRVKRVGGGAFWPKDF
jgi:hypothetical protein